jgi:hypothetical protein
MHFTRSHQLLVRLNDIVKFLAKKECQSCQEFQAFNQHHYCQNLSDDAKFLFQINALYILLGEKSITAEEFEELNHFIDVSETAKSD